MSEQLAESEHKPQRELPREGLKRFLPILRLCGLEPDGGIVKVEVRGLEAPELVRATSQAESDLVEEPPLGGGGLQDATRAFSMSRRPPEAKRRRGSP